MSFLSEMFLTVAAILFLLTISTAAQISPSPSPAAKTDPLDASVSPSEAANQPPPRPRYKSLRAEEDWSFLADESKRNDYLDSIKYIRLRENRDDWFLTLGGEERTFYENYRNENFGTAPRDPNGYLLQRFMLHANLRLGRNFRFFAEVKSGLIAGRRGGARPPDKDELDFNQAFAEFDFGFKSKTSGDTDKNSAASKAAPPVFALRIGRQELGYGAGRLVDTREGKNIRQSFDGARIILNVEKFNVETFFVKPVNTPFGIFDDTANSSSSFWGVYAVRPFTVFRKLLPKSNVDIYYFGTDRKLVRFDQGAGREIRHTFGARFWSNARSFDYDLEFGGQTGKFGTGRIRAGFVAGTAGYSFKKIRFQPRAGFGFGINSGDKNPNDPDLQTFSTPFPRGVYYGYIAANGPNNIASFSPDFSLKLSKNLTFSADCYVFFRQSFNDGLYGVTGNLIRSGRTSRARYIGTQPQFAAAWQIDRHFSFSASYARFIIGDFIEAAPTSRSINYFGTFMTYKF